MNNYDDIEDSEIRIITPSGGGDMPNDDRHGEGIPKWVVAISAAIVLLAVVILLLVLRKNDEPVTVGNPVEIETVDPSVDGRWLDNTDRSFGAVTLAKDTILDGVHLTLLTPMNATPQLFVGHIDTSDADIVMATLAADIRRDNGKIVGAYVFKGEPLAWGLSKKGYCAIIDGRMTIGVADNSPLFEQATETGGYFFRQYPAVRDGEVLHNNPENKSFRRALCSIDGNAVVVWCQDKVLMDEFSQLLRKLGADNAIYLIGGKASGWYVDPNGIRHLMGTDQLGDQQYVNYIVFKKPKK